MLTDPRSCHAKVRRFFESRLWTFLSFVFIAGNVALGLFFCAALQAVAYVVIDRMFASLRRMEREILRERSARQGS
jgi:hypothetical protein